MNMFLREWLLNTPVEILVNIKNEIETIIIEKTTTPSATEPIN